MSTSVPIGGAFADDVLIDFKFPAKAAIATVLRELLSEMEWGKIGLTIHPGDIRAFAAEHGIEVGEKP